MKNKFKLIPAAAALALGLLMSPVHANLWDDAWGGVKDAGEFLVEEANNAVDTLENIATAFEDWITDLTKEALKELAETFYDKMADPMINMANDWTQLANSDSGAISRLGDALDNLDDGDVKLATDNLLDSLFENTSFKQTVQDFKDNGYGSILFMVGVGGGTLVSVEGDLGIAVSVDYILARSSFGYIDSDYDGAIASLFVATGIQVGMSSGISTDSIIGYHLSSPDGVGGLGVDVSLGVVAEVGGGISIGIDASSVPWKVVTGNIALSAGAEITLDVGPSYTFMIGTVCSDGSIKEFSKNCVSNSDSDSTKISPEHANLILTVIL